MNNIVVLEQNIAAVERMLAEDQAWLDAEPDSVAARMQLGSTKNHLADLRLQLAQARAALAVGRHAAEAMPQQPELATP